MNTKQKTIWSVAVLVIAIAAILAVVFLSKKPADNAFVKTGTGIDTSSSSSLVTIAPGMVSIAASSDIYKVTGSYPQFAQADSAFNDKIASAFTADVSQFETSANSDYAERKKTMSAADFQSFYGNGPVYTFDLTSTVVQSNADYVSVVIHESEYNGGAHPFTNVIAYNYDVANQKELSLSDLISLSDASSQARAILAPKLAKASSETTLDENTQSMLEEGTDPAVADNWNAFTFTPTDITIYFGEYAVAPYVFGEQDVAIPRK